MKSLRSEGGGGEWGGVASATSQRTDWPTLEGHPRAQTGCEAHSLEWPPL
jgi:hypothetical protein